jgi:signal transduction histidine kinase/CheY-like chemotaxis protein
MKLIDAMNRSLSKKVLTLMGLCFLFFMVGTGYLFYAQQQAQNEYVEKRENIQEKIYITHAIYDELNSNVLFSSNSLVVSVPNNEEEIVKKEKELRGELSEFNKLIETEEDQSIYQNIDDFITYYFASVLPFIMDDYKQNHNPSVDINNSIVYSKVNTILSQMESFVDQLNGQQSDNADNLAKKQTLLENSLIILALLFFAFLLFTVLRIFKSIGKPLAEFTISANEIAAGREATIKVDPNRKDELGTLSVAFQKMVCSIQDKEQDLVAHNEELIAQQDELQAQQEELQTVLRTLTENEQKLMRRNELINGISSSLHKKEVLQSIVESMCKVTKSDKGIITYLNEDTFASYGISDKGVEQFFENRNSGFILRLISERNAYKVKREQQSLEKGYHETVQYCYDLYLPIISSSEVNAILVFTRYGDDFSEKEITEYETLARQMAVYLEKIKLFEQSEVDRLLNQDILNTVQEGIQLIDKDRKIIQVNQQLSDFFKDNQDFKEMLGLSWDQWSRLMAEQIQDKDFIKSLDELIQSAYVSPERELSIIYQKKDSNQVIRVYCKTFKGGDTEDFGTLLVHRDITKEYEISKMKSEFVSTVSHELRTPLSSVLGFTELLLNKELKPERRTKYLQTIYNEALRLTDLINDFLDIQRMESGKQSYEKKFIDMVNILHHVIDLQKVNTELHQINLSNELEETIILGDRGKIEQVFTNLLSNAIKYSPSGGNIDIRIYQCNNMIAVDIKDEGLGIPKEAIPHLFQQFYRVDNSDRRRIGGTGLGLAIVQEIVNAHNGEVSVSSEYGNGSIFTIRFPKVRLNKNKLNEERENTKQNYSVMIVEDDLSLGELLKNELEDAGFHVTYHNGGKKALEEIKASPPDAVVLDILLEDEIDGWTIMKEMKVNAEWRHIPIFVSTALEEKEKGYSLGAQEYFIKPYQLSELSKHILSKLVSNEKNNQNKLLN